MREVDLMMWIKILINALKRCSPRDPFDRQKIFALQYKGEYIGGYIADLVVEDKIVLELKSVAELNKVMEAQIINYLKLSKCPAGYLMNFNGLKVEWRRFVYQRE